MCLLRPAGDATPCYIAYVHMLHYTLAANAIKVIQRHFRTRDSEHHSIRVNKRIVEDFSSSDRHDFHWQVATEFTEKY